MNGSAHRLLRRQGVTFSEILIALAIVGAAGVALIGLPPSGAFLGKWQLIAGALDANLWFWVAVVLAGSLLSTAYVFRVLSHAFGQAHYPTRALSIGREEIPALGLGLVATLLLGLASAPIWPLLGQAANVGGIAP